MPYSSWMNEEAAVSADYRVHGCEIPVVYVKLFRGQSGWRFCFYQHCCPSAQDPVASLNCFCFIW